MGMVPLPGNNTTMLKLRFMSQRASDFMPVMPAIVESYHAIEARRFAQGGPGWAPLAQSTIDRKGGETAILIRTQEMLNSFIGGGDETVTMTPDFLSIMSGSTYAGYHQAGTTRMPQRKIVQLSEGSPTAALWAMILQSWLSYGEIRETSAGDIARAL